MLGLVGDKKDCEELGSLIVYANEIRLGKMTLEDAKESFSGGEKKLRLTTRYYSADVKMEVCSLSSTDSSAAVMTGMDACVAVNPADLAELAAMLASLNQANIETELSTRLMVRLTDGMEAGEVKDGGSSEALLWCLDHGFELVEMDRSDLFVTWGEREKEGMARVLEALEATMWPSMLRKEKKSIEAELGARFVAPIADADAPTGEEEARARSDAVPIHMPRESEGFPPTPESLMKDIPNPADREPEPEEMQGPNGEKLETFFDDFLQQARQVRETALKGEVSDAERRDRAAKMASQLAAFMGLDGDEDSDEDSSD